LAIRDGPAFTRPEGGRFRIDAQGSDSRIQYESNKQRAVASKTVFVKEKKKTLIIASASETVWVNETNKEDIENSFWEWNEQSENQKRFV
jgi:hypothetical protein